MNAIVTKGTDLQIKDWDAFVNQSSQGNIYHLHAYLSHLLPKWQAVVVMEGTQIVAAFPFALKTKATIQYGLQPYFSQYLGILFLDKSENASKRLEFQKKAIQLIHENIPPSAKYLSYNFAPEFDYELPLIWLGWDQKSLFTYWVDIRKGYNVFLGECASHVRREIKKSDSTGLVIKMENNPETVINILKTAKPEAVRQISPHFFEALCANARHYFDAGKSCCLIGYDGDTPIAGIIYFFHGRKMIYYQGSTLPAYKNAGIMSKIIAESVRLNEGKYDYLDFDGSMIEAIERFFRGFGATPVRYTNFTFNRLPRLVKLGLGVKSFYKLQIRK